MDKNNSVAPYTLDWLTREIKRTRINLAHAEAKNTEGNCAVCAEIGNLCVKLRMLEWLHELTLREVGK